MAENNVFLAMALASGKTVRDASNSASVCERTVYRRLKDPAFCKRVAELRSEMLGQAVGQLAEAATDAVQTLKELLDSQMDSVRLGAARSILEIGPKLRESSELAARVAELEDITEENHETERPYQVA